LPGIRSLSRATILDFAGIRYDSNVPNKGDCCNPTANIRQRVGSAKLKSNGRFFCSSIRKVAYFQASGKVSMAAYVSAAVSTRSTNTHKVLDI
jgi:hypothetical protein